MISLLPICTLLLVAAVSTEKLAHFWQVTDIHYDPTYEKSGKFLSCLSDKKPTSKYGDYQCDAPENLIDSAIAFMEKTSPKSENDFILWTGDSAPHIDDDSKFMQKDKVFEIIGKVTDKLNKIGLPIFPTLGNHDQHPKNQLPISGSNGYYSEILKKGKWDQIMDQKSRSSFAKCGYYSEEHGDHVVMIMLNTAIYLTLDDKSKNSADPCGQFAWLDTTLKETKAKGRRAIISGHVSPGGTGRFAELPMRSEFNDKLTNIFIKYADVIGSAIFGHEHADTYRMIYNNKKAQMVLLLAPPVSPRRTINPSVRRYTYNIESGAIKSYVQYFMDLEASSRKNIAMWSEEYKSDDRFGSLDPANMDKYTDKVVENTAFTEYFNYYSSSAVTYNNKVCDKKCVAYHTCSIRATLSAPHVTCLNVLSIAKGLGIGIIVLIVLGVLLLLGCIIGVSYCLCCR